MNTMNTNTLKHLYLAPVKPLPYRRWSNCVGNNINGIKYEDIQH